MSERRPTDDIMKSAVASSMQTHNSDDSRAALRCAYGDAAAWCDAIGRDLAAENRGRNGKGAVTKKGLELEAVAKRLGDAIWAMRELVTFERDEAARAAGIEIMEAGDADQR